MHLNESFLEIVEVIALVIAAIAVAVIVIAIVYSFTRYLIQILKHGRREEDYVLLRVTLAKALMLGLELLVAADIIETVALESTFESVAVLGLLVLIRTFLSWSLTVEIEGRWPWQPERKEVEGNNEQTET